MFNGWKITNILDVGLCELDTADGPYNKTGYRLEHREAAMKVDPECCPHCIYQKAALALRASRQQTAAREGKE